MLQNSFEIQTQGTHKKAMSLITDTVQKLEGNSNVLLLAIYTAFLPFFNAYQALNDAVGLLEGTYKGKTNLFETLIDNMGDKLKDWEGKIRAVFPEDSSTEIEIFPHKRNPFYDGTYEQRLGALRILRDKLLEYTGDHISLVAVQADIAAYYTLCNAARSTQQGKEGNLNDVRSQRETQRVLTMNAYLGIVYGGLLQQFFTDLKRVGDYIDFALLYDLVSEELIVTIESSVANSVSNVLLQDVPVTNTKKFRFIVTGENGNGKVLVYFAAAANEAPADSVVGKALNVGDNRIFTAAELGFVPANSFMNIFNVNGGSITVEVYEIS